MSLLCWLKKLCKVIKKVLIAKIFQLLICERNLIDYLKIRVYNEIAYL